ncbi:MAG: DUF4012 domain-containing protein [Candidatus Levybacteria bacterium]|nr:DUF4012 domain-containing protein [Candidatus Levybacteria bacterium]
MEPNRPHLITSEETEKLPILIVDKKGMIGTALAKKLCDQLLVVLVTAAPVDAHENVIHIPHHKRVPTIPDNLYSHIFIIYNGEAELLDMLSGFVDKARESKGKLFLIMSLLTSNIKIFSFLHHQAFQSVQIIVYGETFGPGSTEPNETNFFIQQARNYGRIEIPNTGLGKLYPILFNEVLAVTVALAYGSVQHKRIVLAFPHHAFTQISVARLLQKLDPMVRTDFKKSKNHSREYYVPQGGEYFYPDYNLESRLRQVDLTRNHTKSTIPQNKLKLFIPDPDARKKRLAIGATLLFSLFIAPIIVTFFLAIVGAGLLSLSISQAEAGKLDNARQSATLAQSAFSATGELLSSLVLIATISPQGQMQVRERVQIGKEVVAAELEILRAVQVLQNISAKKSLDPKNDFYRALATLKNTLITVQKMEAEDRLPQVVMQKLDQYNGILQIVEGTIDTWPALFGFEGNKTYLVLFQNNMELRPGGGFIGSYGILPVRNGQMEKLQVYDVYDADGQLKQKIEPPYGLRRYLGASNWYLRDSNYELDYTRNAVQAAQFLKLETGQSVDGVIAIDTTFLKNLITVLGKVEVKDYNETVTAENFYQLTQTYAEKDFFPGSTQKKDFLKSLTSAMTSELLEKKNFSYEKLLQGTESSIRQKHLLFSFPDEGIQNVFAVNGLSSSLKDGRTTGKNTFLDFFSVMDANVGTNKANYYLKRSMIQQVAFDGAGGLQVTTDVSYVNSSTKDSQFGGDYKNYARFVLPADAVLQGIAFDNVQQTVVPAVTDAAIYTDPSFIPPTGLEVEQTESFDKKVVGFFFIVPAGMTKTVKLTYTIANGVNLRESAFTYNLRLFKQPGAVEDPYTLFLSYPNGFKPVRTDKRGTDLGGKLVYDLKFSEDTDFVISFSKK